MLKIPCVNFLHCDRYDTDNEHKLHIWSDETEESWDIIIPKEERKMVEKNLFMIKSKDKCVWLIDLREEPIEIHMTTDQAMTIGKALADVGFSAEQGKDQEWPIS